MSRLTNPERRRFLTTSGMLALGAAGLGASEGVAKAADESTGKIRKSLKFGMVQSAGSLLDKFKLLKEIGYDGVELDSPTEFDIAEILKARDASGLVINGTVDAVHWKQPLSAADPAVRAAGVEALKKALVETKQFGGTSVLLVPAVVSKQVAYDDAWRRSQEEIRKALPTAEVTGIKIALENVWNNFLVSPLDTARYIDDFQSPLVCAHFDVGNVLRYGWPEQWIRILGKRVFKLDIKEYSLKKQDQEGLRKGFDVELLEGDCDWPAVMRALGEIGYSGWAAAEVQGGDRQRLAEISERMDRILKS